MSRRRNVMGGLLLALAIPAWLCLHFDSSRSLAPVAVQEKGTGDRKAGPVAPGQRAAIPTAAATKQAARVDANRRTTAPSPACIAALARDAAENASFAAMAPAQRESHIEATARASLEEESAALLAAERCEDAAESDALQCLLSNGYKRARDIFKLYRDHQAMQQAYLRHAERLAARGDARSLLAAATILPFAEVGLWGSDETPARRSAAIEWVARAQRVGTDDVAVQWGVATFREYVEPPTQALTTARAAARRRLLALEPDNIAVHMLAMVSMGQPAPPLDAKGFARLAALPRYGTPVAELATLVLDSFGSMPMESAFRSGAVVTAAEHETATHCASDADIMLRGQLWYAYTLGALGSVESLGAVQGPCLKEAVAANDLLRSTCLRFFARMHRNARTVLERSIAAGIARRVATPGKESEHWQAVHRRQRWQIEQYGRVFHAMDPYGAARVAAMAWRSGDEMTGIHALLTEAGIPLEPPPDWKIPGEPPG